MKKMNYEDIRPLLDDMDIVGFRGTGFASDIVSVVSPIWTHCGLVVNRSQEILDLIKPKLTPDKLELLGVGRTDGVKLLFESTLLNAELGVQVNLLSKTVQDYKGKIYIRRFIHQRTELEQQIYYNFIKKTLGMPYEQDFLEIIGQITKLGPSVEDGDDFDCSELCMQVYWDEGFIRRKPLANKYLPSDLTDGKMLDKNLIVGQLTEMIEVNP